MCNQCPTVRDLFCWAFRYVGCQCRCQPTSNQGQQQTQCHCHCCCCQKQNSSTGATNTQSTGCSHGACEID